MFYDILTHYCRFNLKIEPWGLFDIQRTNWSKYKKKGMPLKHFKTLCNHLNCALTDDEYALSKRLLEKYYEKKMDN